MNHRKHRAALHAKRSSALPLDIVMTQATTLTEAEVASRIRPAQADALADALKDGRMLE